MTPNSSSILYAALYFMSIAVTIAGILIPIAITSDIWGLITTITTLIMTLVLANVLHTVFAKDAAIMFVFYGGYNCCLSIIMWRICKLKVWPPTSNDIANTILSITIIPLAFLLMEDVYYRIAAMLDPNIGGVYASFHKGLRHVVKATGKQVGELAVEAGVGIRLCCQVSEVQEGETDGGNPEASRLPLYSELYIKESSSFRLLSKADCLV